MAESTQSLADFLRVLQASGLVEPSRLAAATAPWRDTAGPVPDDLLEALAAASLLTPGQIEQLRKGRHKGFLLGKYKLLRLLGAGGMSSVYVAEHTTLHHKVAIKVLPIKRVEQSSYLARFQREAQASARLSHPNIARAFDLETAGSIHFIVMEYVEGIDLHAKVKREGPLEVRETAEMIRQVALGLQCAHEEGLVHRDIKPANLMLDKRGTIKILDLGLALSDDDTLASLTREHDEKVLGTADYLAPEQARDSHKADSRSDIYALGCTLYYLLVGKAPFAQGKLAERIRAHLHQPPPNLLEQRPDVPTAIAELYFRMLEKHPNARPQSAQEIADALGAWLAATPVGKVRERPVPPRREDLRRLPGDSADPLSTPRQPTTAVEPTPRRSPSRGPSDGPTSSTSNLGSSLGGSTLHRGASDSLLGQQSSGSLRRVPASRISPQPRPPVGPAGARPAPARLNPRPPVAPVPPIAPAVEPTPAGVTPSSPSSSRAGWAQRRVAGLPVLAWLGLVAGIVLAVSLAVATLLARR